MQTKEQTRVIDLKAVRIAAGLTQRELAERLGFSEASGRVTVAQIEARTDWTVSGLSAFIRAAGGDAELVISIAGGELRFAL